MVNASVDNGVNLPLPVLPFTEELPYLKCPLHTVLKLTPVAYGKQPGPVRGQFNPVYNGAAGSSQSRHEHTCSLGSF